MRYRKIASAFWVDEKVRKLSDDGKLAFLYLLTHPAMTSVGAMRGTPPGLAAELGWPPRRLERALKPAVELGMVEVNAAAFFIGLPKFLRYNRPESPNVCKAWVAAILTLPECPERQALVDRCREHLAPGPFREAFEQGFREAFPEAFGQPFANPEPEQLTGTGTGAGEASPLPPFNAGGSGNGRRPSRKHVDAAWGRT